jgi:hypothetical protein
MHEIENYKAGEKRKDKLSYQAKEYITRHNIPSGASGK